MKDFQNNQMFENINKVEFKLNQLIKRIPIQEKALISLNQRIKNPHSMDYLPTLCSSRSTISNSLRINQTLVKDLTKQIKMFYKFSNCKLHFQLGKR